MFHGDPHTSRKMFPSYNPEICPNPKQAILYTHADTPVLNVAFNAQAPSFTVQEDSPFKSSSRPKMLVLWSGGQQSNIEQLHYSVISWL